MCNKSSCIFCGIIILLAHLLTAQTGVDFRNYSVKDGLSQNTVFSITQDQSGYIWIGTRDGLNKFDGYQFESYRHQPEDSNSMVDNDVRVLQTDPKEEVIWIGTLGGLSKYHIPSNSFENYLHEPENDSSLSSIGVRCLLLDSKGRLWIGTNQGLNLYNKHTNSFLRVYQDSESHNGLSSNRILSLLEDRKGNIWVGTYNGLNRVSSFEGSVPSFQSYFTQDDESVNPQELVVQTIAEDNDGNLWLGSMEGGLKKWNPNNGQITRFSHLPNVVNSLSHNNVRSLCFDSDGSLWIGTYLGLNRYLPDEGKFEHYFQETADESSLSNNAIKSIFKDRKGSIWIGTYFKGVNFMDVSNNRFRNYQHSPYENSLSYNVVSSFAEDEAGNIWVGSEGRGVDFFDIEKGVFTPLHFLYPNTITKSITVKKLIYGEKILWIGTLRRGLLQLDLQSGQLTHYHPQNKEGEINHSQVYALLKTDNHLLIGTYGGGLNRLDLQTGEIEELKHHAGPDPAQSRQMQVRTLFQDKEGNIWVGSEDGLSKLSPDQNTGKYSVEEYLDQYKVYTIFQDDCLDLWVGTYGNGLIKLDADGNIKDHYTTKNGLSGNTIFGILQGSQGHLWISTNRGIVRKDASTDQFKNYTLSDGLNNLEFNFNAYFQTSKGQICFGGSNGFTVFDPANIVHNSYMPPVVFTGLEQFNQPVIIGKDGILNKCINRTETLTFPYDKANFTLKFSALNYVSPEKNQYAYQMEGLEDYWNYSTGLTYASYTIQEAGTYTFRLKASNNDGLWNPEERTIKIKVLPPPWKTWWAYTFYVLALLAAITALTKFIQIRSSLKHKLEIEQIEKLKQEELHQMKIRFFTNITHEFRTPLNLMIGPLESLLSNKKLEPWIQNQLQAVQRNSKRLLNLVNELLLFRKLETEHLELKLRTKNIVPFLQEIHLAFVDYARIHNISYSFSAKQDPINLPFDSDKLEKAIYNLLSNAFKFTDNGGKVMLKVWTQEEVVFITVSDTGKGISSSKLPYIFKRFYEGSEPANSQHKSTGIGLTLTQQLIEMHGGEILVNSNEGQGTIFTVKIPVPEHKHGIIHSSFEDKEHDSPQFYYPADLLCKSVSNSANSSEPLEDKASYHHVLIIEDNDEVRDYLQQIFCTEYKVSAAKDGHEGLKMIELEQPDLILSDVMMPGINGIELCRKIKNNVKISHIPVLLLTGYAPVDIKLEGLENGADDYVTKPFHPEELKLRVKNLIHSRKELRERFVRIINLEPKEVAITPTDEKFLRHAMEIVEENMSNSEFNIDMFATGMAVSRALLFSKIKALTDQTPNNFIKSLRLKRAAQILGDPSLTISEVAYMVGFKDPKYFSKCFQSKFHKSPSLFAKEKED